MSKTAKMIYFKQNTNKICYMIMPEGIRENLDVGLKELSEKYGVSIIVIPDVNWNDDMTPWQRKECSKKQNPLEVRRHHSSTN